MTPHKNLLQFFLVIFFCALSQTVWSGGKAYDSDIISFAKDTLPAGKTLSHPVIKGSLGPSDSAAIMLYQQSPTDPLEGKVIFPEADLNPPYLILDLPHPENQFGFTTVKAVFFDQADSDPQKELFIMCEQMTGMGANGAVPWTDTFVFDVKDGKISVMDRFKDSFTNLATAAAVRQALKKIPLGISPTLPSGNPQNNPVPVTHRAVRTLGN